MTIEKRLEIFQEILNQENLLKASGIHESNHRPHQFTVTEKHIKEAEETNEGILSEEICEKYPCGSKGCRLSYSDHDADRVLVLQLKQDAYESQVHAELVKLKVKLKELGVQGVAFADTEEGYKFLKDGHSTDEASA